MKEIENINIIKEEIRNAKLLLNNIFNYYDDFINTDMKKLGRNRSSAIIIADIIDKYYTSLETLFLRISQFFENSLDKKHWHSDLLYKMTLNIDGVRKQVISQETYNLLNEIMRFRHFRRYYLELDYDWDKLDFLEKKLTKSRALIEKDLNSFLKFLDKIISSLK